MKNKSIFKKTIPAAIFVAVVIIVIAIFISAKSTKNSIAFYNVPDKVVSSVISVVERTSGKEFETVLLDSTKPLSVQVKQAAKCKFIIAVNDCDVEEFSAKSSKIKSIPAAYLSDMPSTIGQSVNKSKNTIKHVPLLYDFYQIDVHYPLYLETKTQNLNTWNDLIKTAEKEAPYTRSPIAFGGNDDLDFLNFAGVLIESQYSYKEYNKILIGLYEAYKKDSYDGFEDYKNLKTALDKMTEKGNTLDGIGQLINRMAKKGVFDKDLVRYGPETGFVYANNNQCGFFFTTLSQHRTIDSNFISNYKSVYCPSLSVDDERMFLAPEICLLPLSNTKRNCNLIAELCDRKQSELSTSTGLAPVNKNCMTADRQADDVRYWLAASSGPLKPLSAALPSYEARKFATEYITSFVLNK